MLSIIQHHKIVSKNFVRSQGKQNFIISQMLIFGGYLKVREFVYTWVVIEFTAILNRIDVCVPMLDWYIIECMLSIINTNNGIKELH